MCIVQKHETKDKTNVLIRYSLRIGLKNCTEKLAIFDQNIDVSVIDWKIIGRWQTNFSVKCFTYRNGLIKSLRKASEFSLFCVFAFLTMTDDLTTYRPYYPLYDGIFSLSFRSYTYFVAYDLTLSSFIIRSIKYNLFSGERDFVRIKNKNSKIY